MKTCVAAVALSLMLITTSLSPTLATVRITDDRGGQIGEYLSKYHALRENGDRVEIDGTCASACTMLLGVIPRNRICVTPRAVLAFHSAWTPTSGGPCITRPAVRATITCGRIIRPMCASGSFSTVDCTRRLFI